MMDNYDRTVELMEMAANAEGKADEQFNKYADTMEYKLNQLGTTWEQFRVRLMDADMFKNAVDNVNELVKRINAINFSNPFDFTKFAVGIPIIMNRVKTMSVTFIKSF
jgi:chemotaxis regulatin CheY-phosphate phosphatase CheZ